MLKRLWYLNKYCSLSSGHKRHESRILNNSYLQFYFTRTLATKVLRTCKQNPSYKVYEKITMPVTEGFQPCIQMSVRLNCLTFEKDWQFKHLMYMQIWYYNLLSSWQLGTKCRDLKKSFSFLAEDYFHKLWEKHVFQAPYIISENN